MPDQIAEFLAKPFSEDMSAVRWFLFVGLILAALASWHLIYSAYSSVEPEIS
jgi:hypothetical protein